MPWVSPPPGPLIHTQTHTHTHLASGGMHRIVHSFCSGPIALPGVRHTRRCVPWSQAFEFAGVRQVRGTAIAWLVGILGPHPCDPGSPSGGFLAQPHIFAQTRTHKRTHPHPCCALRFVCRPQLCCRQPETRSAPCVAWGGSGVCLLYPCTYQPTYRHQSLRPAIQPFIRQSSHPSVHLSIHGLIRLSTHPSIHVTIDPPIPFFNF